MKKARGRPKKEDKLYKGKDLAIKACDVFGATDQQLCKLLEISKDTLAKWKNTDPDFIASLKANKTGVDEQVKLSLFKRATGYTTIEVKETDYGGGVSETVTTTKQHPPDTTAMIFWLKNRMPQEFRDKQTVEHEGAIELPTPIFTNTKPKK
jgi:hypothetical protein